MGQTRCQCHGCIVPSRVEWIGHHFESGVWKGGEVWRGKLGQGMDQSTSQGNELQYAYPIRDSTPLPELIATIFV
jgi:hypothetical protein